MAYNALVLIPPQSAASLQMAETLLANFFKSDVRGIGIASRNNRLNININGWSCSVELNSDSYVAEESNDLADQFAAGSADENLIRSCNRRFEVAGADDPEMEYFNDYMVVLGELGSFENAKIWESASQEFIK